MAKAKTVRISKAALDEVEGGSIILRGVVDPDSLTSLLVDDYQREALPASSHASITEALKTGQALPDIELGMRGQRCSEEGGAFILKDEVYIIDGLQRVSAARQFMKEVPDAQVRLGATVHFGTSKPWERERFRVLNTARLKVSPNVLIRNMRDDSPSVRMLHAVSTTDGKSTIRGRVAWGQRMKRQELLTALTLAKVCGNLHSHRARTRRTSISELIPALDQATEIFGVQIMRENLRTFFDLVDESWGIGRVVFKDGAVYMRGTFLFVLAQLISNHRDFWKDDDKRLFIEASLRRKIAGFPVNDPTVINLAAASGKSRDMLYQLMVQHINSGKRSRRLRPRIAPEIQDTMDFSDECGEAEGGQE